MVNSNNQAPARQAALEIRYEQILTSLPPLNDATEYNKQYGMYISH